MVKPPFDQLPDFMYKGKENDAVGSGSADEIDEMPVGEVKIETKDGAVSVGSLASVHRVYGDPMYNNRWSTKYPTRASPPAEDAASLQHAIVARYKLSDDPGKTLDLHSIVVQSPLLKQSLAKVLKKYPGVTMKLQRVEFNAPFECFVHRWDRLLAEREALTERREKERVVTDETDALQSELAQVIRDRDDLAAHGVMTFKMLWTIFEPGHFIHAKLYDQDRIYKILTAKYDTTSNQKVYKIDFQSVQYDGTDFGYTKNALSITDFIGTKRIRKLEAYPLNAHKNPKELKARLTARGKMFEAYKGLHFLNYNGIALGPKRGSTRPKFNVNSRIIIDAKSYNRQSNSKLNLGIIETRNVDQTDGSPSTDEDTDDGCVVLPKSPSENPARSTGKKPIPPSQSVLTPDQQLLASGTVRGYSLRDKKWFLFFIDNIQDIVWHEDAFASLVMPADQKDLILSFAESQVRNLSSFDDFIPGKGQGIIMLLAGPPGVGKTLTAESVAEEMRAPLYSVGAADLGSEFASCGDGIRAKRGAGRPSELETKLQEVLDLCSKWNAVLLLDEADVFMETRSTSSLERNKLVAIFLRLLEYFSGLMFLTTNRLSDMDPAFESRIHLTLNYTDLDKASRKHIWTTFLSSHARTTGSNGGENVFTDAELERLTREKLNGRQIKNVVKTAGLLASKYEVGLGMGHLETVLRLRRANERKTVGFFGGD